MKIEVNWKKITAVVGVISLSLGIMFTYVQLGGPTVMAADTIERKFAETKQFAENAYVLQLLSKWEHVIHKLHLVDRDLENNPDNMFLRSYHSNLLAQLKQIEIDLDKYGEKPPEGNV